MSHNSGTASGSGSTGNHHNHGHGSAGGNGGETQGTASHATPATKSLYLRIEELVHRLKKDADFFLTISEKACAELHTDQNCWNGDRVGDYTKNLAGYYLTQQSSNPEVTPVTVSSDHSTDPDTKELVRLGSRLDSSMRTLNALNVIMFSKSHPDFESKDLSSYFIHDAPSGDGELPSSGRPGNGRNSGVSSDDEDYANGDDGGSGDGGSGSGPSTEFDSDSDGSEKPRPNGSGDIGFSSPDKNKNPLSPSDSTVVGGTSTLVASSSLPMAMVALIVTLVYQSLQMTRR